MSPVKELDPQNCPFIFSHQTTVRSQLIYSTTLMMVILSLTAMPFIYINIRVKSKGMLQSAIEKTELFSPISGRLLQVNLMDNQSVTKGKLLLVIDQSLPTKQDDLLNNQSQQLLQYLADVRAMLSNAHHLTQTNSQSKNLALQTDLYRANWQQYLEQMQNANQVYLQARRIYQRYQALYHKKIISQAEFEIYRFNDEQALSAKQMLNKKHQSQWQMEAAQYRKELILLKSQKAEITEHKKQYTLRASTTGSLQNLHGLKPGDYISAHQKIGEISPTGDLFAYCYVSPSTIGFIKIGQPVRIQIDAFNYNQWGILTGKVIGISDDLIFRDQVPYFRVKSQIDKKYLQLKNGYKGYLKKGMSFNASFTIARRSLYQLLYDKVDDWFNPQA